LDFIDNERNSVLKEYRRSFQPGTEITLGLENEISGPEIFEIETDLFRPIVDGFGAGEDARDIYATAVAWWDLELTKIEKLAMQKYEK
jgi:hypothetical protein